MFDQLLHFARHNEERAIDVSLNNRHGDVVYEPIDMYMGALVDQTYLLSFNV